MAQDYDDIIVERSSPEDPFAMSTTLFAEAGTAPAEHRIKLFGRVIETAPNGVFILSDGTQPIEVHPTQPAPVRSNDFAEALGFPSQEGGAVALRHASFRLVAPGCRSNATAGVNRPDLPAPPFLPLLEQIDDIRRLSQEEAEIGFPVR